MTCSLKKILASFVLSSYLATQAGAALQTNEPKLLPVPIIFQATDYSCGAAALLGLLMYWKAWDAGESTLYGELETTPTHGTKPGKILDFMVKRNFKAELRLNTTLESVFQAVDNKEPVIVALQAWADTPPPTYENVWDHGHYAVVIGYDATNIYFMDPSAGKSYGKLTQAEFLVRWHDEDEIEGKQTKAQHIAIFAKGEKTIPAFPDAFEEIK